MSATKAYAFIFMLASSTLILGSPEGWYAIWEKAGDTWYEKWDVVIRSIDRFNQDQKMELLGKATALGSDANMNNEKREIFSRAQNTLLAIPGHAEYYRDRINGARERMETLLAEGDEGNYPWARYELSNEVMYGFETLQQLPSVETVQVLGEFLYDERGYVNVTLEDPSEKQRYESSKHSPVYRRSAEALAALPIVGKLEPPRMELGGPDDTKAWKQWYQEIKDGKRTFRFEGDPVEYDLNGPAPKDKVERIARDQKREVERQGGRQRAAALPAVAEQATTSSRSRPVTIALLIASIVLLGSIGFYILRKRRHGARR